MRITLLCVAFCAAFGRAPESAVAQLESAPTGATSPFAQRVLDLTAIVLERHIDPPTRQQMVLMGTKSVYANAKKELPKGLSRQISDLTTRRQMVTYLNDLQSEFSGVKDIESDMTAGILQSVSGGAQIAAAENMKIQGQLSANRYVGTGIALGMDDRSKRPLINKVFYDGPAWKAGAKDGDLLMEINGATTASMKLGDVVKLLRGTSGSLVSVMVKQPQAENERPLEITRGVAFIPTVHGYRQLENGQWQYQVDSHQEIAYLRINRIGSSTVHELRKIEAQLSETSLKGIVLDLRFGGAILHDTILVADALLDGGTIGHVRSLDSVRTYDAGEGALFQGIPMAVLVDRQISAGSEFLAAALQDRDRARVVGERTGGAGYVRAGVPIEGTDDEVILATGILQRGDGTPLLTTSRANTFLRDAQRADLPGNLGEIKTGFVVPSDFVSLTHKQRGALSVAYAFTRPGLMHPVEDPVLMKAVDVLRDGDAPVTSKSSDEDVSG